MRFLTALVASAFLLGVSPVQAIDIQRPDPALSPAEVISIQLEALKNNDDPRKDAGIKQTYALAHPQNKRMTGPLPKFTQIIKSPMYKVMLDHRQHAIEQVAENDRRAVFGVTVTGASGDVYKFRWTVQKIGSGDYAGAWATTAVSPPQTKDDSI